MKWHPSQIGKLMTNGRGKNDIGATAISYIKDVAKENFYGYRTELNTKQIIKGKEQEQDSIDLLNTVRFEGYVKNIIRVENELMTGECDIITNDSIIDVKTSWSLDTFPAFKEDAYNVPMVISNATADMNPIIAIVFSLISLPIVDNSHYNTL